MKARGSIIFGPRLNNRKFATGNPSSPGLDDTIIEDSYKPNASIRHLLGHPLSPSMTDILDSFTDKRNRHPGSRNLVRLLVTMFGFHTRPPPFETPGRPFFLLVFYPGQHVPLSILCSFDTPCRSTQYSATWNHNWSSRYGFFIITTQEVFISPRTM